METDIRKPPWIRGAWPCSPEITAIRKSLRQNKISTVCEESACPNLDECFTLGTATFMIMGNTCTRNCGFCNIKSGEPPLALDPHEPVNLAETIKKMGLQYVVITSVNRDDLADGGAAHFAECIKEIRKKDHQVKIEILTPDFRHSLMPSLTALGTAPPDVFNHNIETVPRLYPTVRPESDYQSSLNLLKTHKELYPTIPTKSGLTLGLGETDDEIHTTLGDLRANNVDKLTIGQYLQPSKEHLEAVRFVTPLEFMKLAKFAYKLGFKHVTSSPLARPSYHAKEQV